MDIPYVPCLVDRAAISGRMSESDGAIVIDSVDNVWAFVLRLAILAMLILFNHHSIVHAVVVGRTFLVPPVIILLDKSLATLLDIMPVRFEANVVNHVTIEHQLRRRCAHGGMQSGTHREAYCIEETVPSSVGKVVLRTNVLCGDHVVYRLVSSLNH